MYFIFLKLEPYATETFPFVDSKRFEQLLLEIDWTHTWINIICINLNTVVAINLAGENAGAVDLTIK